MSDIVITIKIPKEALSNSGVEMTPQDFETLKEEIHDIVSVSSLVDAPEHVVVDGVYRGLTDHGN